MTTNINHRQQNKFNAEDNSLLVELLDGTSRTVDYIEIEKAIKDFCFIRNELSNYSYLYASQLSFEGHLNLPYWEYLFVKGQINKSEIDNLEDGSLLTIYLLFSEIFEEEGYSYLYKHNLFDTILETIKKYNPDNERKKKIVECIKFSIENYSNEEIKHCTLDKLSNESKKIVEQLNENDKWVYSEFVENYFTEKAKSFESLRQMTSIFFKEINDR